MRRDNYYWLAAGVVLGSVVATALCIRRDASAAGAQGPARVRAKAAGVLERGREVRKQRDEVLSELVELLSVQDTSEVPPAQSEEALHLMGDLHMSTAAAASVLGRNAHFATREPPRAVGVPPPPWEDFPAFGALARVGLPAIPVLVAEIRLENEEDKRQRCVFFLNLMVGKHAKSWLSDALEHEHDAAARARLEEAMQYKFHGAGAYSRYVWFLRPTEDGKPWYKR